jgi:3',5'-cyclic-nucleotide phosphodiesterase
MARMSDIDVLGIIIAASGHDVGHPALTNRFLINSRNKVAIRYNDQSVLENMHCATTFKILLDHE